MMWYRDQLAARLRASRDPASVGTPTSAESRDIRTATFAVITRCIGSTHPADATQSSMPARSALPLDRTRLLYLVEWYENTYGNGKDLARKWDRDTEDPRWKFMRWCRTTERVLRHRFEDEGII